jgi:hypothetical protein
MGWDGMLWDGMGWVGLGRVWERGEDTHHDSFKKKKDPT